MHQKDFANVPIMWTPTENSGAHLKAFRERIRKKYNVAIGDNYWDLHQWSLEHLTEFWAEIWDMFQVIHSVSYDQVIDLNTKMEDRPEWFRGARLNFAENILKFRDDRIALIVAGEDRETEKITFREVYEEACRYGAAFRKCSLKKDDRVMCYMSNRKESVFAMIGVASIGALWGGALPLLGAKAVLNRFKLVKPKILITVDRFKYDGEETEMLQKVQEIADELPSLEKVIIVTSKKESRNKDISKIKNSCFLDEFLSLGINPDGSVPPLKFEQLSFNHPLFISYTSGTTGTPKVLIHGFGCLLSIFRDFWLHNDATRDSRWLSMSPVGWASWNFFISFLSMGMSVVLFEGVPFFLSPTFLWDMVDEYEITHLFLTPSALDDLEKKGYIPTEKNHLNSLKTVLSGASVVKPQNYDFVYKKIKTDIVFGAIYGCTELMGVCLPIDHTLPIHRGEHPALSLGLNVCCYDDSGKPIIGELGEVVITTPTPSMPLGLLGDEDGQLYKKNYFSKFKGVFAPGDLCIINPVTKGIIICGRSDETLKPRGARFGSSEIYNIVNLFPEVNDSVCVGQYNENRDERAVLFLKMRNEHLFSDDLIWRIREAIARELSKRHVPEVILEVKDIPHNMNGKKMEIIVKKIVNGQPYDPETVINPECLREYYDIPALRNF